MVAKIMLLSYSQTSDLAEWACLRLKTLEYLAKAIEQHVLDTSAGKQLS
jgi:hypothetical protein